MSQGCAYRCQDLGSPCRCGSPAAGDQPMPQCSLLQRVGRVSVHCPLPAGSPGLAGLLDCGTCGYKALSSLPSCGPFPLVGRKKVRVHLIWLAQDTESQKLKAKTVALTNIVSQVLLLLPPGVPFPCAATVPGLSRRGRNPLVIWVVESPHFMMFVHSAP